MRDYKVSKALQIASQKNRQASRLPIKSDYKKWAMREHKKQIERRRSMAELKVDRDYSKHIEIAIFATIVLAVLSVSHPQLGTLATILAILVFAAIVQGKFQFDLGKKPEEKEEREVRHLQRIHSKIAPPPIPEMIEHDEVSYIEFPYKRKA
ncbi:MAG: hypothetical protein OHK0056_10830 [Bacteriovoracaceae bacterium]